MKHPLPILSLSKAAAIVIAAFDPSPQNHVYQSYTAPFFPISLRDIQFRSQKKNDAYYRALKTFNNLIALDEFPATALPFAIVTPSSANNHGIGQAIRTASEVGIRVSARSGGYHSGYSSTMAAVDSYLEDFVLIDLHKLDRVTVNPEDQTAIAEPGATGQDLYEETIKYGLHFPGPHAARVTIGGFLLQGGMGIGSRCHGAGVDNIIGIDIVLYCGRTIYADSDTESDLFNAIRGGGQFFGVVTKFYLRLVPIVEKPTLAPTYDASSVPIDQVFAIFDRPQANDLLRFYGTFDLVAPKLLENKIVFIVDPTTYSKQFLFASFSAVPSNSSPEVKAAHDLIVQWYKHIPTSFATSVASNYDSLIHASDSSWADWGLSYYAEDVWLSAPLDPKLQQVLIEQWDKVPSSLSTMALNTGPWDSPTRSALGFDRSYSLCIYSTWKRNGDRTQDIANLAWLDETIDAIKPWILGYYANELRPRRLQDKDYWRKCYEEDTYNSLITAKTRWDPHNIFKSL
ncbi:hypothetical protein BGZ99_002829 [Dissophora globulifera]|uniref:FAD-binding PCMH-type domain-containing protein n=1 Tax=Dissophora globulifera TaxID=979702 RepID=A0A9P6RTI9_9FUNG|nr:hypothetical protein BGZ99_002829 [Dissophora globulifera]